MNRLVIEVKENGDLHVYTDGEPELTVVFWKEVREDANDLSIWDKREPVKEAERELLHKTTGLKQIYP